MDRKRKEKKREETKERKKKERKAKERTEKGRKERPQILRIVLGVTVFQYELAVACSRDKANECQLCPSHQKKINQMRHWEVGIKRLSQTIL